MSAALGQALVGVPTEQLKALFRALVRGELNYPLTAWEFARHGLQSWQAELLDVFRGLDAAGVRAVLVVVLAERKPKVS